MSALDDGTFGDELVTDLGRIKRARAILCDADGYRLPLQDAERDAGLSEADIWPGLRGSGE